MNLEFLSEFNNWIGEHIVRRSFWLKIFAAVLMIAVGAAVAIYFWPEQTKAASVGPRFATASGDCVQADNPAAGATDSWTSPGNAFSDNATNATTSVDGTSSEYIKCTNFGFTSSMIPSGSTIDGIVVTVERFANTASNASQDAAVRIVKGGVVGATDRSTSTPFTINPVAENHGGSTDTWGEAWSAGDVTSSNFGVAYSATKPAGQGPAVTVSVDYISITVYFSAPTWNTITQRQGIITNDQNNTILSSHTAKIGERMRVILQVDTNAGAAKNRVFKLQYDKNDNSWSDVRPAGEIRAAKSSIIGLNKIMGTDQEGVPLFATCNQGYMFQETNRTDSISIGGGTCHDIGFVVDTKNASASTTYRFRLYDVTGVATLNTYAAYPSFSTVSSVNDTIKASRSNVASLSSAQSDLKTLLDNQGYSNIDTDDAAREIMQSVSSDTTADVTITGGATNNLSGNSVSNAGDVNGDGYSDVIVGAYGYSSNTGRAYIYYGGSLMDNTADVTLTGDATTNFGTSVAGAGDVNGDGYSDVIVGATGYVSNTGRSYIYYGSSSITSTMTTSSANVTMTGAGGNDYFGNSVSFAGDVNGDGYDDVVVAAYEISAGNGLAYIFYGGSSMDNTADVSMTGEASGHIFGAFVDAAGDVNGDGYDDLIVGAYGYSSSTGRAYVFYGGSSMNNTADITMTGEAASSNFGISVAGVGDVNGDGYADVVVGANGYSTNTGRAYVFYGGSSMNNTADVTITGGGASDSFGTSAASAGDVNGDGYSDLVIGASGYSTSTGRTYVYLQSYQMDNTADKTMTGEASSRFGYSVGSAGDVNGDGYADVVVGAYQYSSITGRAYIYYGGVGMDTTADVTMTGEATGNQFGWSVAGGGDVNGDGYADVVVGAPGYNSSSGRVYVYYGGVTMNNVADVTLSGPTGEEFGSSVANAGDVNGDGYADVVVGSLSDGTFSYMGSAKVYYGGSSMDTTADLTMSGEASGDTFGDSVDSTGDLNGDGYVDVVVGAPGHSSTTGKVYVYHGGSSMDSTADLTMTGEATFDSFGGAIASKGDINGDGYADLVVGASGAVKAYVYYGGGSMNSVVDVSLTEGAAGFYGFAVSSGDANGDGYADVVVGANGYDVGSGTNEGRVYIYYGSTSMDATADVTMTGDAGSQLGGAVDLGDTNGDGYADLVVGASVHSSSAGRSYVYLGGNSNYVPTFNLAQKHSDVCSGITSIDAVWNGQSSVAGSTNNLILQVYRFGSTNAWETVDTESSLGANTDGSLTGSLTTNLSEYCDGSNWSYWRLYQASGQQSLQTDEFEITFTGGGGGPTPTPTPIMDQRLGRGNWWLDGVRQFLHLD